MTIDPKEVIEVAAEKVVNEVDARALIKLRLLKRSDVARICRVSAPMVDSLGIPSFELSETSHSRRWRLIDVATWQAEKRGVRVDEVLKEMEAGL
jgi:hypothetical protein